jgi:CheY-like chemotaxis protein
MRILLIEDDGGTARSIELMLNSESFNVYTTDLGEEGIDLGKIYDYDIILLDLNLPDMSGFEVLRSLRVSKVNTPILVLTGLATIEDKVRAIGVGADDYLTKPFSRNELVARIHAIVRRSKGHAQSVIQTGGLTVDVNMKKVSVNGTPVYLTGKDWRPRSYRGRARIQMPFFYSAMTSKTGNSSSTKRKPRRSDTSPDAQHPVVVCPIRARGHRRPIDDVVLNCWVTDTKETPCWSKISAKSESDRVNRSSESWRCGG